MAPIQRLFSARVWLRISRIATSGVDLIPFIGRLDITNGDAWKKTTIQTILSVVLSSLPIWAAAATITLNHEAVEVAAAARYAISHGELLLLAGGAVSPLIYLTATRLNRPHPSTFITSFPHGAFYLLSIAVVLVFCGIFVALRALQSFSGGGSIADGQIDISSMSFGFYGFAVFLYFTANFHKNAADKTDGTNLNRPSEDRFSREWDERDV